MNRKLKLVIAAIVIVAVAILFVFGVFQRQYRNVFMEVLVFPEGGCGDNSRVYRFIVQNNGTFISYAGINFHCNVARPDFIMLPFGRTRTRINLSDDDFRNISEMTSSATENHITSRRLVRRHRTVILLYDGRIYERSIGELHDLADELIHLSPLLTRSN